MTTIDPTVVNLAEMDKDEKELEQKMIKVIEGMPAAVRDRFKVLHMLSEQRNKLNDEFNDVLNKLSKKYFEERTKPVYVQRQRLLDGEDDVPADLLPKFDDRHVKCEQEVAKILEEEAAKKKKDGEEETPAEEEEPNKTDVSYLKGKKGIPDFWSKAIKNCQMTMQDANDKDQEILDHVKYVEVDSTEEGKKNFTTLTMHFHPDNDFLTNEKISCTLEYENDEEVKEIKGTEIEWIEGKDPTKKKIKKKQKHKKTGETRTVMKTVDCKSFFSIFKDRKADPEADPEDEEAALNEEMLYSAQTIVEHFDEELIPAALQYYLNMADQSDPYGDEDDEGDEDDMDGEDGEKGAGSGDDDDKPKKKKKGKKGGEGAEGEKKDCKQQ